MYAQATLLRHSGLWRRVRTGLAVGTCGPTPRAAFLLTPRTRSRAKHRQGGVGLMHGSGWTSLPGGGGGNAE